MILSTKGRYAVMAMVDLAAREAKTPVTLSQIAEQQEIPLAYLEQLFARLKKAELVKAVRGPRGGYFLADDAAAISIAAIINAAEESIEMTRCGMKAEHGCVAPGTRCLTHDLWEGLTNHIHDYLQSISLADVCAGDLPILSPSRRDNLIEEVRV